MLTEDLELGAFTTDTVEATAEAGGLVPPGKYHVRLNGSTDVQSKKTGNVGAELEYVILVGPFAGKTVKDSVWKPEPGDNGPSANRFVLIAHRLGLLAADPKTKRYIPVQGKTSFGDCLGAEVVIEVNHRTYKRDDGTEGKAVNVTFGGIWRVDDVKVKDVPKAKAGAAPVVGPAPKPKSRVDNL
jgi:hypothetical protein